MPRRRQHLRIGVVCKKRLHLGITLCPEDGTSAIQQAPAGTQQRPQSLEQGRLQGCQLGNVGFTAQPAHVWMATHNAGRGARCVEQDGVERHATALRLPPVLRAGSIGHQDLGRQPQALQGFTNADAACGIDFQRRDLQGDCGPAISSRCAVLPPGAAQASSTRKG